MSKVLLILTFLATGAGALHVARQHANQLQQKVQAANESWQFHTQQLVVAQSEKSALTDRVRELQQALAQSKAATVNALWSVLKTNRADRLSPELRQRVLAELGFDWRTSPDYIVVSKQAVRDVQMKAVIDAKLTDVATAVLALTPQERGQVEAALQRVKKDFTDWMLAHVERAEPKDDLVAQYTLPKDDTMSQSISNNLITAVAGALGGERAELILPTSQAWMKSIGLYDCDAKPVTLIIKRYQAGDEQRLKAQTSNDYGKGMNFPRDLWTPEWKLYPFPRTFRLIFPNGWADVAKREGFELPPEPEKK
ncbi:MAG: hypothetical protein HY298_08840 [Verrucomicrobia bacterium]|nr:hypothetical protein [Verrucomicrobiota bacterium]